LGLFVGAGCPVAIRVGDNKSTPLIPDIAGMTKAVRATLGNCAELKVIDDHFKKNGREHPNLEDMLSHIRALRTVAGNEGVRGMSAADLDSLDKRICQVIYELADKSLPNTETPYHHLASWVSAVERESPVEVFTTNYDLLMEQAFEYCCVPYFDGFAGAREPFFDIRAMEQDVLPPRWARLWKLHGSINWYQTDAKGVLRGGTDEQGRKRVIHPSHLKYEESRRMPYLAMIDRLRAFLKQPTAVLVVCGYSFRDEHLNEVIVQGLQGTPTAVAFGLLFGLAADYSQAVRLATERQNLTLLAKNGAVISGREARWAEKDTKAATPDSNKWVTWTPLDPADADGKCVPYFMLGDFAIFGEFLHELIGDTRPRTEIPSAN